MKKELKKAEVKEISLPTEMVMAFHSNIQAEAQEIIAEELIGIRAELHQLNKLNVKLGSND